MVTKPVMAGMPLRSGVEGVDGGECALGRVDRRAGQHVGEPKPCGVEQPASLCRLGQPRGGCGRRGAGVGTKAHFGKAFAGEAQGEAHAVVAASTTGAPCAIGLVDRAGAREVDHAEASRAASRPCSISAQATTSASISSAGNPGATIPTWVSIYVQVTGVATLTTWTLTGLTLGVRW
jgi:hypothetical protein